MGCCCGWSLSRSLAFDLDVGPAAASASPGRVFRGDAKSAHAERRGARARPVAFVDDMHRNLISVQEAVPDAHLFHLMADNSLRALLPPTPQGVHHVEDWPDAAPKIASALGI